MSLSRKITTFNSSKVQGAFRHLINSLGMFLVGTGYYTESEWQLFIGLAMAVLAFIMSFIAEEKNLAVKPEDTSL